MSFLRFLHPPSRRRGQGWGRPIRGYGLNKYIILLNNIYFNKIKHLSLGLPFGFHWPMAWIIPSLARHRDTPCKKVKRSKSHFRIASWHLFGPERVGAKRSRSQKVRLELIPGQLTSKRKSDAVQASDPGGMGCWLNA